MVVRLLWLCDIRILLIDNSCFLPWSPALRTHLFYPRESNNWQLATDGMRTNKCIRRIWECDSLNCIFSWSILGQHSLALAFTVFYLTSSRALTQELKSTSTKRSLATKSLALGPSSAVQAIRLSRHLHPPPSQAVRQHWQRARWQARWLRLVQWHRFMDSVVERVGHEWRPVRAGRVNPTVLIIVSDF